MTSILLGRMLRQLNKVPLMLFAVLFVFMAGCSSSGGHDDSNDPNTFTIVSGSENKPLEPIVARIAKDQGYKVKFEYKGSIDAMHLLQGSSDQYDGVWLASKFWIDMGDTDKKVKYTQSIATSPIVFGIKQSKAQQLGFVGKDVRIADIRKAVEEKQLTFMMTSATQSNSGLSAYLGFLHSMLNKDQALTLDDLHNQALQSQIQSLLKGVNRTSGSSGWLKDLYLKGTDSYDAMVNYEAVLIETNQELVKENKEPLYLVYPIDGLSIADFSLGYINNGNKNKEDFFLKLQQSLLSDSVQKEILDLGRRTGFGGTVTDANPAVFNPGWGIDLNRPITPIPFPSTDVVLAAMNMYQTEFKKPSYTVFALDYSGSMFGKGESQLKSAMRTILDQQEASKYLLQSSDKDVYAVVPFNDHVINVWKAGNINQYGSVLEQIDELHAGGGTDIYRAAEAGLDLLNDVDLNNYTVAIILMTDGKSDGSYDEFERMFNKLGKDIPVFSIMFGSASDKQLNHLADLTRGKLFDGTKDLISAFKEAKGYN